MAVIFNLSPNIQDIKECAASFGLEFDKQTIVDFTGYIKLDRSNFYSVCQLPGFREQHSLLTKEYVEEVGKLGQCVVNGKPLGYLSIAGLPLFWSTRIAVKHILRSIAKTVFLLDKTLSEIKTIITVPSSVHVSVPPDFLHYRSLITRVLKRHGVNSVHFSGVAPKQSFMRSAARLFRYQAKTIGIADAPGSAKQETYQNYFITVPQGRTYSAEYRDFYFHNLYQVSASQVPTAYWPVLWDPADLRSSVDILPPGYLKAKPTLQQTTSLSYQLFYFLKIFRVKGLTGNSFFSDKQLIEGELYHAAHSNAENYFYGVWLKNFFSVSKARLVIYQDEFYQIGRIISAALEKTAAMRVAVQHGIFDTNHPVYVIGDEEVKPANSFGLPLPDVFVVWSDWFRKRFLGNNSLGDHFIKVLGSCKHLFAKTQPLATPNAGLGNLRILWCTDTVEFTQNDLLYLEDTVLNNPKYDVTLRRHPLYDFTTEYSAKLKLFERFPRLKMSQMGDFSEDLHNHDVVIVNCFTTAFIDANLAKRPCLRMFPYKNTPALLNEMSTPGIFNIYGKEDVLHAIEVIRNGENTFSESNVFFDNDVEGWKTFLRNGTCKDQNQP